MTRPAPNTPGDVLLPRPPGVFRRWLGAHPRFVDGFIVGSYLFGCALVVVFDLVAGTVVGSLPDVDPDAAEALSLRGAYLAWPWLLVSALIVVLVALALAYRRRFPFAGVVLVAFLLLLEQGLLALPNSVALIFLLYAVPVYKSVRAGWVAFAVAFVSSIVAMQLTGGSGGGLIGPAGIALGDDPLSATERVAVSTANGIWLLAVLLIGINLGNRRRYVEALIDRAHQLAREREQRAQLAAASERSRIAREMHDIVAHSLSVVVTLSEAAAVAIDTQPAAAKQALERSAETGRQALVEMRRLLGVLNEESGVGSQSAGGDAPGGRAAAYAPQPGLAQLPELIGSFADAGLRIKLTQEGMPVGDATQQLAVYRIVQEGLTNALRHAGPGTAVELSVRNAIDDSGIAMTRVEVADSGAASAVAGRGASGSAAPSRAAIPGAGRGLAGAAERARMFGGSLEAGPHGRGWRLLGVVPASALGAGERSEEEDL